MPSGGPLAHDARARIRAFVFWLVIVTLITEGLVALSATCWWPGSLVFMIFELAVPWSPAIAAWLASRQCQRSLADIGWKVPSLRMLAFAYAIPLAYALATYGVVWLTGLGHFPDNTALAAMTAKLGVDKWPAHWALVVLVLHHATLLWLRGCVTSLGEEIGWRGFLLPELVKIMPFRPAAIVSGLIWAVWHFPLILFGGYHGHTEMIYSLACFTLVIIAISFPLSWLRLKSGDVWTCTAFHASHNLFILKLFNPLTVDAGHTKWLVSEFGIMTVAITVATAWCFRSVDSAASSTCLAR